MPKSGKTAASKTRRALGWLAPDWAGRMLFSAERGEGDSDANFNPRV